MVCRTAKKPDRMQIIRFVIVEMVRLCTLLLVFLPQWLTNAYAEPPGNTGWEAVELFSDEFNGIELDTSKWNALNPKWGGRPPSRFSFDNVSVTGGNLLIRSIRSPANADLSAEGIHFLTGIVKSRTPVLYGYFEMRGKVANSHVSSAFWLYDHGDSTWSEIDIFELCGVDPCRRKYNVYAHARPGGRQAGPKADLHFPFSKPIPASVTDTYFIAGLEWSPETIKWYLNGELVRAFENRHWHSPLYLVFDSEVMEDWFGLPEEMELPATFKVDYVRAWRKKNIGSAQ